ncbi:ABC transporter ATP-binding protein [Candidatus Woesearchaeota archaeon]|nr:ABC transporter ATP-binding protein [Candidatus Woesearchaeota archaeon]
MQQCIEFHDITKTFGNVKVLRSLNLRIEEHDLIGLIGRSGEGKTTLLRTLIGFYKPDSGKIIFKNKEITKNTKILRNIVGFCTQENSFYPELTIEENLHFFGKLYGIKKTILKTRAEELLTLTELYEKKGTLAGEISGGMKRRLDFAIALIHDPEILILDEPTTGLDPIIRQSIWDLIEEINKQGKTIIVSSHLLDFIEDKCKKIAVLKRGDIEMYNMKMLRQKFPDKRTLTQMFTELIV